MKITSEQQLVQCGRDFANSLASQQTPPSKPDHAIVIELLGDVGAGKTTFTRGLAEGLGATTSVTSPSYTISKLYPLPSGGTLIHYDFYRLTDPGLMADTLRESLSTPGAIIVVEWGTSVTNLLPRDHYIIKIEKSEDNSRIITIEDVQDNPFGEGQSGDLEGEQSSTFGGVRRLLPRMQGASPVKTGASDPSPESTVCSPLTYDTLPLFLDTSTSTAILKLGNQEYQKTFPHNMSRDLLAFIRDKLQAQGQSWRDLTSLTFYSGPGSFTGLRIGATIMNTLARELQIPLYDHHGTLLPLIIPDYGRPAHISTPKK